MTQELFNFLDTFKLEEDKEKAEKIKEIKSYFDDFYKRYPSKDIERLCELSEKELMTNLIIANNPLMIKEALTTLDKYPEFFPNGNYGPLLGIFLGYFNDPALYDLINRCISKNIITSVKALAELIGMLRQGGIGNIGYATSIVNDFFDNHYNFYDELKGIFKNFNINIFRIGLSLIETKIDYIYSSVDDEDKAIYESMPRDIKRRNKSQFLSFNKAERDAFVEAINSYYGFISKKINEVTSEYEKSERERKRHNKNIDELKRLLNTTREIKDIDSIIKLCPNDEIKNAVLNFIDKHNKEMYLELLKEYEKTRQNSDENLTILFAKYNFEYKIYNPEEKAKLKDMLYEDLESLLIRLNNLGINNLNILNISLYKLGIVEELLSKGLINLDWLSHNISILYTDNKDLEQVVTNIDILSKESINMIQYQNSLDITKSDIVEQNLYLLRIYGLNITKTTLDIKFLSSSDLRDRIEFVYSLGIELSSLDILNNSVKEILKIKIADSLNIPVSCISDDEELLSDISTSIIPKDIEEKLNMDSKFTASLPSFLEEYKVNDNVLCIDGIYVSILKVKRNLAKLEQSDKESIFCAIIYHGYYTYEEIEILRNNLILERNIIN